MLPDLVTRFVVGDTLYLTPWGCLSLEELNQLAWKANDAGELEERDEIWKWFDKCASSSQRGY